MDVSISSKYTKLDPKIYFVQGDKDATSITFKVNPTINDVSLLGLTWQIKVVNTATDTFYAEDLPKTEGSTIDLTWLVSENYTGKPTVNGCCNGNGGLCVILQAYESETIRSNLKIDGFEVLKDCQATQIMTPDYFADLLAQLQDLRDQAEAAATKAEEIQLHPVIVGSNGNYWNWVGSPSEGQYEDSGIAPAGSGDMKKSEYDADLSIENIGGIPAALRNNMFFDDDTERQVGWYMTGTENGEKVYKPWYEMVQKVKGPNATNQPYNYSNISNNENTQFNRGRLFLLGSNTTAHPLPYVHTNPNNILVCITVSNSSYYLNSGYNYSTWDVELYFRYTKSTDTAKTKDSIIAGN